jgi:hypothetical protein
MRALKRCVLPVGVAYCASLGCAQILGIEETELHVKGDDDEDDRSEDEPVEAGPAEPGRDFSCVGESAEPGSDDDEIEIIAHIVDIAQQVPLQGIRVTACRTRLDIDCRGGTVSYSDAEGIARVPVRNGFNGYLKVESEEAEADEHDGGADSASTDEQRVGYLWYFSEPLTETYIFPIQSMTQTFRDDALYGTSPVARDPERGEIAINVTDCSEPDPPTTELSDGEVVKSAPGVNAPDVHFELTDDAFADEDTVAFYLSNSLFAFPSKEDKQVTDASGLGGFLNVKPGSVPISAVPRSLGSPSATDQLLVRAGFLTTLRFPPARD